MRIIVIDDEPWEESKLTIEHYVEFFESAKGLLGERLKDAKITILHDEKDEKDERPSFVRQITKNNTSDFVICDVCKDKMYCDHTRKDNDMNCKDYMEENL